MTFDVLNPTHNLTSMQSYFTGLPKTVSRGSISLFRSAPLPYATQIGLQYAPHMHFHNASKRHISGWARNSDLLALFDCHTWKPTSFEADGRWGRACCKPHCMGLAVWWTILYRTHISVLLTVQPFWVTLVQDDEMVASFGDQENIANFNSQWTEVMEKRWPANVFEGKIVAVLQEGVKIQLTKFDLITGNLTTQFDLQIVLRAHTIHACFVWKFTNMLQTWFFQGIRLDSESGFLQSVRGKSSSDQHKTKQPNTSTRPVMNVQHVTTTGWDCSSLCPLLPYIYAIILNHLFKTVHCAMAFGRTRGRNTFVTLQLTSFLALQILLVSRFN